MIRLPVLTRRKVSTLLLGACVALAVSIPPARIAARLDAALYDMWSGIASGTAPPDIAIVEIDDPAWLSVVSEEARHAGSKLVVTTLPEPPSSRVNELTLGPTEIMIRSGLLRRTDWLHGGHMSFAEDADGRVRSLPGYLQNDPGLPSLAVSAHKTLHDDETEIESGRMRFVRPDSFTRLTAANLVDAGDVLSNRIVIIGAADRKHETPVGPLGEHELLAQAIAAYSTNALIRSSPVATAMPWVMTIILLSFAAVGQRRYSRKRWLLPAGGIFGLFLASGLSYYALAIWMPVAAPLAWLLTSGSLLSARQARDRRERTRRQPMTHIAAHEALAAGNIEDAWRHIHDIPASRVNLDDLCEFGEALEARGYLNLAADTYYRAALVDPHHRDVARRLVEATRRGSESQARPLSPDTAIPGRLGRYELLEPIGRGSTGIVYLAIDPSINRLVALKVIDLKAEYDAESLDEGKERFRREAESAGRLNHPNIVTIFDVGESDGVGYIAMEYVKGRHLSDFTSPDTLLPPGLVLELGAQVAEALAYAHDRNVVHRDIKPGNIMYDSVSGALTITDFGIARLIDVSRTRTGIILGTPSFMAPEQLEGENVNRHTDLFALGVSLYELLTGQLPFLGASMTKLMFVIANEPHQPVTALRPDLPPSVDALMDIALAKRPEDRYANGTEMAAALRYAAGQIT